MTESDPTGYDESAADSDGAAGADPAEDQDSGVTLTTDEDAQDDDSILRPGNAAD